LDRLLLVIRYSSSLLLKQFCVLADNITEYRIPHIGNSISAIIFSQVIFMVTVTDIRSTVLILTQAVSAIKVKVCAFIVG